MSIKIILIYDSIIKEKFGMRKEVKRAEGRRIMTREKINRCSVLGIRNWDGAVRRVHVARETSRRDRCGIKKTRRGRVFLIAMRETCPENLFS